jgi:hypothetical protein
MGIASQPGLKLFPARCWYLSEKAWNCAKVNQR